MTSPTSARTIEKILLVIGESGVGKSTLINMLFNGDTTDDCCKTPCKVGSTAASVTKHSSFHLNMFTKWCFVDTVGIGDPEMTTELLIQSIRTLIRQSTAGVDCVAVVMKMERMRESSRANLFLLRSIFHKTDLTTNAVLVLTHWDGELEDEERDLSEWLGNDEEMHDIVACFSKVILTNNKLGRGSYPECRQRCLRDFQEYLAVPRARIYVRPVDMVELVKDLMAKFGRMLWKSSVGFADLLLCSEDHCVPTYCGDCPVCFQPIKMTEAITLPCNHAFHPIEWSFCWTWNSDLAAGFM